MPIVETIQKIGKIWRQGLFSRPTVKNIDMGVFSSAQHDVSMADGEDKNLSKITVGDRVVGYNVDTREKETYQVTGVEMIDPERFYYVLNGKYAFHRSQSVMIGKNAIHVFRLRKGQKLQLEDGTLEEITSIKRVYTPCPFIKLAIDGHHTFYLNGVLVHNASRYWVGGTSSWNGTAGTKWATTSGGGGGSAEPTASDDVFLDAASGTVTVTISTTTALCLGFDCTGFTGTLAGSTAMTVSGSYKLVAGMTRTHTGAITFNSTSTGRTITFGGKTMANGTTFNGVGGGWTLQDTWNNGSANITLTNGTLDTNGKTVTGGTFASSNSNTRTLTLGASTLNVTSWSFGTVTGLTFNSNTSTINVTGPTMSTGGLTYNVVVWNVSLNASNNFSGASTFATFTINGTSANPYIFWTEDITVSGTFTIAGLDAGSGRIVINRNANDDTKNVITAATTSLTNVDFRSVQGAGAAAWTGTAIGNLGNNSGITFTGAVTRYWVGNGGNWSSTTHWSTSTGGASGASVPLPQDTVVFDANSFSSGSQTVTGDCLSLGGDISFTGVTNTPTFAPSVATSLRTFIAGSLTLVSGMNFTGSTTDIYFVGDSSETITSAGKTIASNILVFKPSATLTMQDNLTMGTAVTLTLRSGTFDMNDFDLSVGNIGSNVGATRVFQMGSGTLFLTTTTGSTPLNFTTGTGLTVNAETSTVDVNGNTATARTLTLNTGGQLNNLKISNGNGNLTLTQINCKNLDFTGFTGTLLNGTIAITVRGDLTLDAGMTIQASTLAFTMAGTSGTQNLTSNGVTVDRPLTLNGVGGTFQLADSWNIGSSRAVTLTNGTFDLNDFNLEAGSFSSSNSNTRVLTMGSGTFRLKGTGTVWNLTTATNFTINKETGTIKIDDASATGKTFIGGAKSYYRLLLSGAGTGSFTISNSNTFDIFEVDTPPHTVIFTSSTVQTINTAGGWKVRGTAGNLITIQASTATNATITITSGTVVSDYLSISDSTANGGAAFYAGANSVDAGGGNSGWIFTAPAIAFVEQVVLVDTLIAAAVLVRAFDEVATLVDSFERTIGKVFVEAAVLVDTMNNSISRAFSEAVVLVDTISNQAGKFLTETVELVDSIAKQLSMALSNSVTLVDSITRQMSFALFNSVTLVDTFEKVFGKIFTETVTLAASVLVYLNGLRAGVWSRVGRVTSTWSKTSRISTTWDKVSRIVSTWTKIDRP